jgi:hypothetical protein
VEVCLQTAQLFLVKILFFDTNFVKISWILGQQILILLFLHKKEEEEEEEEKNFLSPHSFIAEEEEEEEEEEEAVAAFLVGSVFDVVGCDPLCEQIRVWQWGGI